MSKDAILANISQSVSSFNDLLVLSEQVRHFAVSK